MAHDGFATAVLSPPHAPSKPIARFRACGRDAATPRARPAAAPRHASAGWLAASNGQLAMS
eukprot:357117-Chlamydomonas_euryale.AAC.4